MSETPGWDAIEASLKQLYPGQEPLHYGTIIKWMLGGPDPLDGISIYQAHDHWHYVSYGFSELYEKEGEDAEWSGYGMEMTFRLRSEEAEAPVWPVNLMQNLARYTFNSGNVFGAGDYVDLNGPIALETPTRITAAAFMADPELPDPLVTPNGKLQFRQLVGLTAAELSACKTWQTTGGFLDLLQERYPLAVTRLERSCLMEEADVRRRVEEGRARDGSRTGFLFVSQGGVEEAGADLVLTVGALAVDELKALLPGRLGFGKGLSIKSEIAAWNFLPGDTVGWDHERGITLTPEAARGLAEALRVKAGDYRSPMAPGLVLRVIPTAIRDAQGEVVRMLGE